MLKIIPLSIEILAQQVAPPVDPFLFGWDKEVDEVPEVPVVAFEDDNVAEDGSDEGDRNPPTLST